MPLVDHPRRSCVSGLRSLGAVVICALRVCWLCGRWSTCSRSGGFHRFLQLAPGEFLFVSFKVAGYGLTLALPFVLYQGLAFVLPGLTRGERGWVHRRADPPCCSGGPGVAWWALVPAALRFLVSYGADVVEPIWSIERYLDFVLLLVLSTGLAFQVPVLQLLLGRSGGQ